MPIKNPFAAGGRLQRLWLLIGTYRRQTAINGCINRLMETGPGARASGIALALYKHWGDPLDQARETYVRSCLAELKDSKGSVMLSGASLMTLIMGAAGAAGDPRHVWCFEQDPHWSAFIRSWLHQYQIKNTFVITAAPALTPNMVRYTVDTKRLPKNFGLVLCEGSRASPKSVISTLNHLGGHLSPVFTLLARKVKIDEDGPLLKQWAAKHNATFVIINRGDGFIKISRRGVKTSARYQDAVVESLGR